MPGDDLVLTIDRTLQYQVEQALVTRVSALKAKGGSVVVMDTATGDIYAVANVSRDPETYEVRADGVLLNTGIAHAQDPVRMAHAMKLALESFIVQGGTTTVPFLGKVMRDAHFARGDFHTKFLEQEGAYLLKELATPSKG